MRHATLPKWVSSNPKTAFEFETWGPGDRSRTTAKVRPTRILPGVCHGERLLCFSVTNAKIYPFLCRRLPQPVRVAMDPSQTTDVIGCTVHERLDERQPAARNPSGRNVIEPRKVLTIGSASFGFVGAPSRYKVDQAPSFSCTVSRLPGLLFPKVRARPE